MPVLLRKSLRDLRTVRWQAAGIALLVAILTILVTGGVRARSMLSASRDVWYERLSLADIELRCSPTHRGLAEMALQIPAVAAAEERLLAEGLFRAGDVRDLPALIHVLPGAAAPTLNGLHLLRGHYPGPKERGLVIDRSLVAAHGLALGDVAVVRVEDTERTLPIVGISLSPEHVLFPVHPEYTWPLRGTVAVVGISEAATQGIEKADRVDSLLIRLSPGADGDAVLQALLETLPISVTDVLRPEDRPGHAFTAQILATFTIYMSTTALLLAAVGLALLVMTLLRLVQRQRRQMGTLVALGYGPLAIASSFLAVSIVPTLVGTGLGALLTGPFSRTVFRGYAGTVGYLPMVDPGPGSEVLWMAIGCLVVAGLACFVPALALAWHRPAQLLSGAARRGAGERQGVLVHLAARLRDALGLPLSSILGLTHISRRRGTTLTAVLGLGAILAVVIAFLLVHATHRREVASAIDRMGLDATVHFREPQNDEAVAALARAAGGEAAGAEAEPILSRRALLRIDGKECFRRVLCIAPGRWTGKLQFSEGSTFSEPDEATVLIDRWISGTYGVEVGDVISFYAGKNAPEGEDLRVAGVLDGVSLGLAVLPLETGRRLFGLAGLATGAQVASDLPEAELESALWAVAGVESVFGMRRAAAQIRANFEGSERVLGLALLMAICVSIVFLGVLAALDAEERAPDYVVLTALGWRRRSILAVCLTEVMVRGILALGLGLLLAPVLANGLLDRIAAVNHYRMVLAVPPALLLGVGLGVLLALPLGAWPALRAARRLAPARALRRILGD